MVGNDGEHCGHGEDFLYGMGMKKQLLQAAHNPFCAKDRYDDVRNLPFCQ
jgi:hypothetical protein